MIVIINNNNNIVLKIKSKSFIKMHLNIIILFSLMLCIIIFKQCIKLAIKTYSIKFQ